LGAGGRYVLQGVARGTPQQDHHRRGQRRAAALSFHMMVGIHGAVNHEF
jgi:hypothetical protein